MGNQDGATNYLRKLTHFCHPEKRTNVYTAILSDLKEVANSTLTERKFLRTCNTMEKQQRLLYLFQRDLLPGVGGRILEVKIERDTGIKHSFASPRWAKIVGYVAVIFTNAGALFYIFLFALRQTKFRQDAWFRSFMTWLGMDVILVSSMVVVVSHFVIPSYILKDLLKIKERLIENINEYHRNFNRGREVMQENLDTAFNSAEYFFVLNKLARMEEYRELLVAKAITNFSTPWPRQSYQHFEGYSDTYPKFTTIFSNMGGVLATVIGSFVRLPPSIQDAVQYSAFSVGFGYTMIMMAELYYIYPALVAAVIITCVVLVHYIIRAVSAAKIKRNAMTITPKQSMPDCDIRSETNESAKMSVLMHWWKQGDLIIKPPDESKISPHSSSYEVSDMLSDSYFDISMSSESSYHDSWLQSVDSDSNSSCHSSWLSSVSFDHESDVALN